MRNYKDLAKRELSVASIKICHIGTSACLANELIIAACMSSEEINKDEINEIENDVQSEETLASELGLDDHGAGETQPAEESDNLDAALQLEKDKYVRLYSDFDNFRRRTAKEKIELLQTAGREVITEMLPVLDDFERALKASEGLKESNASVLEGFQLIHKKMLGSLEAMGLKPMNSMGESFDAEVHEAVTKIPAPNASLKGKIVDELEKGYYLNDKVIRFAKVVVGE